MAENIAKRVTRCLSSFKLLVLREQEPGWSEARVQLSSVQDELSRFKVWAGNIGAHRTGRSSLEYRLRDASHIRAQVLRLLDDLNELLEDADSILRGEKIPWDKLPDDDDVLDDISGDGLDDADSSVPETELSQILRNIADVTSCLLRLSVAIRNPAPHDRFRVSKETDTTHYEPFDINHVKEKFPQAGEEILQRLGKAISRRRQYFKYRECHHATLAQGLDLDTNKIEIVPKSTIASSIPDHLKEDKTSTAPTAEALDDDAASDTGISQTSYATSVAISGKLRVPPLPKEAEDGPFECPFCYMMIVASSRSSWKKHVFRDLRPYVCLCEGCEITGEEFSRRHQWMDHVLQYHWKIWRCPSGCDMDLQSASSCREHLTTAHPGAFPPDQIDSVVKLSERPMNLEKGVSCPLCDQVLKSAKQYQRHVGGHQEQISLFALPNVGRDEGESDQSGNDENSNNDDEVANSHDSEEEDVPIHFTDPMHRVHSLRWSVFKHWRNMKQFLETRILSTSEDAEVFRRGNYVLYNNNSHIILNELNWDASAMPGMRISMWTPRRDGAPAERINDGFWQKISEELESLKAIIDDSSSESTVPDQGENDDSPRPAATRPGAAEEGEDDTAAFSGEPGAKAAKALDNHSSDGSDDNGMFLSTARRPPRPPRMGIHVNPSGPDTPADVDPWPGLPKPFVSDDGILDSRVSGSTEMKINSDADVAEISSSTLETRKKNKGSGDGGGDTPTEEVTNPDIAAAVDEGGTKGHRKQPSRTHELLEPVNTGGQDPIPAIRLVTTLDDLPPVTAGSDRPETPPTRRYLAGWWFCSMDHLNNPALCGDPPRCTQCGRLKSEGFRYLHGHSPLEDERQKEARREADLQGTARLEAEDAAGESSGSLIRGMNSAATTNVDASANTAARANAAEMGATAAMAAALREGQMAKDVATAIKEGFARQVAGDFSETFKKLIEKQQADAAFVRDTLMRDDNRPGKESKDNAGRGAGPDDTVRREEYDAAVEGSESLEKRMNDAAIATYSDATPMTGLTSEGWRREASELQDSGGIFEESFDFEAYLEPARKDHDLVPEERRREASREAARPEAVARQAGGSAAGFNDPVLTPAGTGVQNPEPVAGPAGSSTAAQLDAVRRTDVLGKAGSQDASSEADPEGSIRRKKKDVAGVRPEGQRFPKEAASQTEQPQYLTLWWCHHCQTGPMNWKIDDHCFNPSCLRTRHDDYCYKETHDVVPDDYPQSSEVKTAWTLPSFQGIIRD